MLTNSKRRALLCCKPWPPYYVYLHTHIYFSENYEGQLSENKNYKVLNKIRVSSEVKILKIKLIYFENIVTAELLWLR